MAESKYKAETGEDGEDTDELLCADEASDGGLECLALPRDHCDLLLDAIDAELSRLQSQNFRCDDTCKGDSVKGFAYLCRSPSLSKDTGLGSNSPTNDKEYQDLERTHPIKSPSKPSGGGTQYLAEVPERVGSGGTPCPEEEEQQRGLDSRTEQCRWRLERLLGRADREAAITTPPASDSICTEDFTERFKEETVDLDKKSKTDSCQSFPYDTVTLAEHPDVTDASELAIENRSISPPKANIRYLAGVPVRNFDGVTIDSDLDSVRTEQVHRHLHSHNKVIKAVEQMDSMCSDKSDCDTLAGMELDRQQHGTMHSRATIGFSGQPTPTHYRGKLFSSDDNSEDGESLLHFRSCHKVTRHLSSNHRRLRASRVKRIRGDNVTDGWMEVQVTERRFLEETLSELRKDSEREENKLIMTRAKLSETEQSLTDLLKQRQCVLKELDLLGLEVTERERDCQRIQANLRDSTTQADTSRCELRRLHSQRDSCLLEVRALQEELEALQRKEEEGEAKRLAGGVSLLERDEMDRLLEKAKSELFTEQRRFRHTLDSMSERLDDAQQELDQREEELRTLRRRCVELEVQLTDTNKQREEQEECLQRQLKDHEGRVGALERIVAQKEVLLLGVQEEKSALHLELSSQKEEHHRQCTSIQQQGQREKEEALEAQRLQLSLDHEKSLQQAHILAEDVKSAALKDQAQSHTQRMEAFESCVQLKEEEVRRLTEALEKQEEAMRRREKQLRAETEEKVQQALEKEQRRWEEQREVALQEQHGRLKREAQEEVESVRAETERERRNALGLQSRVLELQTKVQTLEHGLSLQQKEQSSVQAAMARALREEHQAEIQGLRKQAEEETQRESLRIRQSLQQSEAQLQTLQAKLAEQEHDHKMALERSEQRQRCWAQQLQMECQRLQGMMGNEGHTELLGNMLLGHNLGQAVEMVQTVRQQAQKCIARLQQELELQKHNSQKLEQDKEHELRLQREQILLDKERALQSLRERLIQEHIEELSVLNRCHVRGAPEGGGVESLRRQLREKDEELRQVQRGMGQWKERTAARLARKLEEEMTAELERRTPRVRSDPETKLQRLEEEMRQLTMCGDLGTMPSAPPSSSSSKSPNPPATLRSQDLASYKLLRHLQSRIRQLHSESRAQGHSTPPQASRPAGLVGSYLETITGTAETSRP